MDLYTTTYLLKTLARRSRVALLAYATRTDISQNVYAKFKDAFEEKAITKCELILRCPKKPWRKLPKPDATLLFTFVVGQARLAGFERLASATQKIHTQYAASECVPDQD